MAGVDDEVQQGVALHSAGRLAEAEAVYRRVLTRSPDHADAIHLLGVIAHQSGRNDAAAELIGRALALAPGRSDIHCNLGEVWRALGRNADAEASYRQALALQPDNVPALNGLGLSLLAANDLVAATEVFERAARAQPNFIPTYGNLALALKLQGRLEDAAAWCRKAVERDPNSAIAYSNLGVIYENLGRLEDSANCHRKAIGLDPNNAAAHSNAALVYRLQGKMQEAITHYHRATDLQPTNAQFVNDLGTALEVMGRLPDAVTCYQRAISLDPVNAGFYGNLNSALRHLGKLDDAVVAGKRAVELNPKLTAAHNNLGVAYEAQGLLAEAAECYRRALALGPDPTIHSNLLLALNYAGGDPAAVFAEHADWGRLYGRPRPPAAAYPNPPDPARRLRVGYVSADLREHSVAYFLEPVLRCHDRAAVEPVCYSDTPRADAFTAHLRNLCPLWRDSGPMSHDRLAEQVRADGIDILVDLGGHTAWNRLPAFALAPAPVQATYLGYPNTTGLPAVGYRITDATADPPGDAAAEAGHAERLVRLPRCFLSYRPPAAAPPVADPPCLGNGFVTFGSFNALAKVTAGVLGLWASVLHAVPGSRLVLKAAGLADPGVRGRVLSGLADHGVGADRLTLAGREAAATAHLAWYGRVDVGLDPTPYAGTTTTCEALWMGVPVVTLAGDRHAGRVGASVLAAAGLGELVADTPARYVAIAAGLAADPSRLTEMRRGMRDRLRSSALMDHAGFTRHLEAAYRRMWHEWCAAAARSAPAAAAAAR